MRTFSKSSKLDNVLYDVRGPVVEEAARMEEEGRHVLKLNIGNPAPFGFSAPEEIIRDMITNVRDSQGYSDSRGIFSARKAIMQYCQIKKIPNVTMDGIYTGKAFYGMKEYLKTHQIRGKNVLFLHTGGAPLFFDELTDLYSGKGKG